MYFYLLKFIGIAVSAIEEYCTDDEKEEEDDEVEDEEDSDDNKNNGADGAGGDSNVRLQLKPLISFTT